jgi:hypothetical protein
MGGARVDFSVVCPNDGSIEVGLECISTIIFRGFESVVVVFVCPRCGAEIQVSLQIPDLLVAAVELEGADDVLDFDEDEDVGTVRGQARQRALSAAEQARLERYCEYFRRQLAKVDDVESVLAEIEGRQKP